MSLLSFLGFGGGVKAALQKGAVIIDVRTAHEFDGGHPRNAINIPIDRISSSVGRIRQMNKPVVVCCESGHRSGQAVSVLKQNGLKEVYNGGNWMKVLDAQNALDK
jgi:phage shock protein E